MKAVIETPDHEGGTSLPLSGDSEQAEAVRQELNRILASGFFRSAGRSRQFLEYVVQQKLEGHPDLLKERTIGTEVFHRPPGYATGDDPDSTRPGRRRVCGADWSSITKPAKTAQSSRSNCQSDRIRQPSIGWQTRLFRHRRKCIHPFGWPSREPEIHAQVQLPQRRSRPWIVATICVALLLATGVGLVVYQRNAHRTSVMDRFWKPMFATQQPVLICLAKPVTYRPSQELYQRYERTHPSTIPERNGAVPTNLCPSIRTKNSTGTICTLPRTTEWRGGTLRPR